MHVIPLVTLRVHERSLKFRRQVIFSTILVNLLGYVLTIWILAQSRQSYQMQAETSAQNAAKVIRHSVVNTLQTAEVVLLAAKAEIEQRLATHHLYPEELKTLPTRIPTHIPFLSNIDVIATPLLESQTSLATSYPVKPNSAPAYTRSSRDHPLAGLYISQHPSKHKGEEETLLLSQRFNHPDGSFAGVLNAQLKLHHFQTLFSTQDIGANGVISLRNEKLATITRRSSSTGTTQHISSLSSSHEFQAIHSGLRDGWLFVAESPSDNMLRTTAVYKVSGFPFYVSVGMAAEDYFAKWWESVATTGESLMLFSMMTVLFALAVYHTRSARFLSAIRKCPFNAPQFQRTPFRRRGTLPVSSQITPAWRRDKIEIDSSLLTSKENLFSEN